MPSSTPIPDEAVEALLESKVGRLEEGLNRLNDKSRSALRDMHRDGCRDDLQAAYPHLLASFEEHLLGDAAVEAVIDQYGELLAPRASYRLEAEAEIKRVCAALSEAVG